MKQKLITTTILLTALVTPAHANLQVSATDSDLGRNCYSEEDNIAKYSKTILFKIIGPKGFFDDGYTGDKCQSSFSVWDNSPEGACWLSISDDKSTLYSCSIVINTAAIGSIGNYSSVWTDDFFDNATWTPIDNHRATLPDGYNEISTGDYTSRIELTGEYGCDAGYYSNNPSSGENMTCTQCPPFGNITGTSEIGNTSITGCHIPAGKYNDQTGEFTLSNNCYYIK